MGVWPRRQVKGVAARVRSWPAAKDAAPLGFAGYKVGMTHLLITDTKKTTLTKGSSVFCPATIIECPPIRVAALNFYKTMDNNKMLVGSVFAAQADKELGRKLIVPKTQKKSIDGITDFDDIRLLVHTQPKLTAIGKKKPEAFELALGGKKDEKLAKARDVLGKELKVSEVFRAGQQLDLHTITKGKGTQGPIKRFGISIRRHKSEKTKRGPGTLGGWSAQAHFMYRVAHAGKMGHHQRTEYNKWILKIGSDAKEVSPAGGFQHYGLIRNDYLLLRGSVGGPSKSMVRMVVAQRPNRRAGPEAPPIEYLSKRS